jgi:hypothetical protein
MLIATFQSVNELVSLIFMRIFAAGEISQKFRAGLNLRMLTDRVRFLFRVDSGPEEENRFTP